jgi:hypothetical protein
LAVVLLVLLIVGWGIVVAMSRSQAAAVEASPWARSLVVVDREPEFSPRYPLMLRRLEASELPEQDPTMKEFLDTLRQEKDGLELIEAMGLERNEFVEMLDLPQEQWQSLLAGGRLPQPGAPEVLRGALARYERFVMDGVEFAVVGQLRSDVPGLEFGYALPEDAGMRQVHFSGDSVRKAWLLPKGGELVESGKLDLLAKDAPLTVQPLSPAPSRDPKLIVLGLALMAIGGSGLQMLLLAHWSRRRVPVLGPVLREIATRPVLLSFFHALYYGLFFGMMLLLLASPLWNMRINAMVEQSFRSEGILGTVHAAYASGDVAMAAFWTWLWNYGVATVLLVLLPSVVPVLGLLFGLGKTGLSFGVVGAAMSPMWVGMAKTLVYHSGTMVLELEAYIVAAFVVTVFTWYVLSGLATIGTTGKARLATGLKVLGGGAVLVGVMLAIAALYEASTVIAFSGLRY